MSSGDTKRTMTILRWVRCCLQAGAKKFTALAKKKMVGHSGNVIANDPVRRRVPGLFRVLTGHAVRMIQKKTEQRIERGYGTIAVLGDRRVGIQSSEKKTFQVAVLFRDFRRERGQPLGLMADIVDRLHA